MTARKSGLPRRLIRVFAWLGALALALYLLSLSSCTFVPFEEAKTVTTALSGENTRAADVSRQLDKEKPGHVALIPLLSGGDALAARLRMIEDAEKSIDVQTFLIKPDAAGTLVWLKLYEAANRGVRVRLLFDDIFTTASDDEIATLNAHPNVEIRVFNPLSRNSTRVMNFVLDFARVNRRMHNKAMVVDGSLAIIGGRNIADEYYQIGTDHEFADFDLLVTGAVIDEVSNAFDLYWNDHWSVPLEHIVTADPDPLKEVAEEFRAKTGSELFSVYSEAIQSEFLKSVIAGTETVHDGTAHIVVDDPEKLRHRPGRYVSAVTEALMNTFEQAESDIMIMTPYFVPGPEIAELLATKAKQGLRVSIVTNSLASTNHAYVHGGYAKYRADLLKAGVEILEVRADAPAMVTGHKTPLTMHTKLAVIDRHKVFAGSANIDPRSINLNTEIAMIIESQSLANGIRTRFDTLSSDYAFTLNIGPAHRLNWIYDGDAGPETHSKEPGAGILDRLVAKITGWLPVEGQL